MERIKKSIAALAFFMTVISSGFSTGFAAGGFADVPDSNPYSVYINDLHQKGVTSGTGDGRFGPTDSLTRAQFSTFLVKAFNLPMDTASVHFTDLAGHWAAAYIQTAWDNGVVSGLSDTTFGPEAPVSREEAATMVWRYLSHHGIHPSVQNFMLPSSVDDWAAAGVAQCVAKGLFGLPFQTGTYQDAMNREEAAALIDSALAIIPGVASTDLPDTVKVTRANPLNQPIPTFTDRTVQNTTVAKQIYNDLEALPLASGGPMNCPMDNGVAYHLTFTHDNKVILEADVEASGCRMVTLSGNARVRSTLNPAGDVFWSDLETTLGLTDQQLHGTTAP